MQSRDRDNLKAFFEPESLAVFGSLREHTGLGYGLVKNLLDFGFKGRIYPVNPTHGEILGLSAYGDIDEVPGPVDLAVVITPAPTVPGVVEACAKRGVKGTIIVSEHFAEASPKGARLQQQLVDTVRRTGIRIMGPNTIGTINTCNGLITTPYLTGYTGIRKGGVAYCSQSGIVSAQCQPLADRAYPISKMCDLGNKCDVNEVDLLNYLADDPDTKVVSMHMEDARDGREFLRAARKVTARKPLLILRTARSKEGARASASHTGSLAGNDLVYDTAIRQSGAIRLNTWEEYWEIPRVFESQPPPRGNRVAIIAYSGGAGVVATDAAIERGLVLASLSASTLRRLAELDPRAARNPIDMGPVLSAAKDPAYVQDQAITAVLNDPNVDCASITIYVGILAPTEYVVELFDRLTHDVAKPIALWLYGPSLSTVEELSRRLGERGAPAYAELETAIKALGALTQYSRFRSGF